VAAARIDSPGHVGSNGRFEEDESVSWAALPALFAAGLVAAVAGGANGAPATPRPCDRGLLARAVEGARARLARPACAALLDEFADPEGVSLRQRLDESGWSIEERLAQVRFLDGSSSRRCLSSDAYAFTARGWPVVYVCSRRFARMESREPVRAEAVIIHELLHSIGLGENPPNSSYVTLRIEGCCYAQSR
jgi:hypothetical protein